MSGKRFEKGNTVKVIASRDFPDLVGRTGTVRFVDGFRPAASPMGVTGLRGTGVVARLRERIVGIPCFYADELEHVGAGRRALPRPEEA